MPVNIHVSDPIWAYEPQNRFNDGLMNAFRWRLDNQQGIMGHNDLIESLERAVRRHRKTVFIAAHLVNLNYDPKRLGELLDRHPNLYADISARFSETAAIPRAMAEFHKKLRKSPCLWHRPDLQPADVQFHVPNSGIPR